MDKYVCEVCGYVYDPAEGDPDNGVDPGTAFGDLPRVSHYAGLRHLVLPFAVPPLAARDLALSGGAALVVVEEEHLRSWAPALRDALWDEDGPPKGYCLVKEWKKGPRGRHTVRAYRIVPLDGE